MTVSTLEYFYPEVRAGGFTRVDGTVEFFARVNALLDADAVVLDFGAGRGRAFQDGALDYHNRLTLLRGKVRRVIGVDIDPVVTTNPSLDEAHVLPPEGAGFRLPLADATVDLVIADHVFEHVADPALVAGELARVLKPGGWVCARTPNRWGYIAVAARLIPERLHDAVLARAQPHRKKEDVFPAHYRLNTRADLAKGFPPAAFEHVVYAISAEPAYAGNSRPLWALTLGLSRLLPETLKPTWLAFLRKRGLRP